MEPFSRSHSNPNSRGLQEGKNIFSGHYISIHQTCDKAHIPVGISLGGSLQGKVLNGIE